MKKKYFNSIVKNSRNVFFVLFCVLCTSCLPLTSNGFKNIHVNYSAEQVIDVLGEPATQNEFYSKKYMVYYVHDSVFSLFFNLDQFPFVGFYPLLRTGTEYWVILDNNKVVGFGPAKRFGNNIPKALDTKNAYTLDIVGGR